MEKRVKVLQNITNRDFPDGPVSVGSIPDQGTKIPHAAGQLSLPTVTAEPTLSGACTPQPEKLTPQ